MDMGRSLTIFRGVGLYERRITARPHSNYDKRQITQTIGFLIIRRKHNTTVVAAPASASAAAVAAAHNRTSVMELWFCVRAPSPKYNELHATTYSQTRARFAHQKMNHSHVQNNDELNYICPNPNAK